MSWLRRWLGAPVKPFSDQVWHTACTVAPLPTWLDAGQRARLRSSAEAFVAAKRYSAAAGLVLDETICAAIAAHACLPLLGLDLRWLDGWTELIIYPEGFLVRRAEAGEDGVVLEAEQEVAGEAWSAGPLVLSWGDLLEDLAHPEHACNVVIHEIAHKLDGSNGAINGMPALHADMPRQTWTDVMQTAFDGLNETLAQGRETWVDPYAASAPEEFFAVISEHFFMQPGALRQELPEVYGQLRGFYRIDPHQEPAQE